MPQAARCLLTLVLAMASLCRADQIVLDNGDRLTGKIVRLSSATVVVHTDYAGDVSIEMKRVASLRTDEVMTVVLEDNTRLHGRLSGDGRKLEVAEAGQTVD